MKLSEISREDISQIKENGATIITYSDPSGKKHGFEIFSLKKGNNPDKVVFSKSARYLTEESAKDAGLYFTERITTL